MIAVESSAGLDKKWGGSTAAAPDYATLGSMLDQNLYAAFT